MSFVHFLAARGWVWGFGLRVCFCTDFGDAPAAGVAKNVGVAVALLSFLKRFRFGSGKRAQITE